MSSQPEAFRLIDTFLSKRDLAWHVSASAELRRLQAENERLREALKAETARCAQVNEDAAKQYDAAMRHYWNSGLDVASRALRNAAADMRKGAA